ncbi:hypothetical protein NKR19_g3566 [Coniochaeta hoffmannii]|uniref:Amidoligase enzyme-domain-containing protein n=1 Tax=Coniochaeta hoffmannii TaxID=91930 RepID=A0AA38RVT7_9PEZI|nr:hypothetical protein NKR19_g3566 [Coniochaeta hoffmannii]
MDDQSFQFGVELELLLGSRKNPHANWKSLAKDLSKRLLKAGIPNHVNDSNDKSAANYTEWSIVQEATIPSQPAKSFFGLELVSPIYPAYSYWASDLQTIFSVLHAHFALIPSPHCSTHVHISPISSPFSVTQLSSLSKSILYFESPLDLAFPQDRTSYWCQSNRLNPSLSQLSLSQCLSAVNSTSADDNNSPRGIVELMNLFPATSAYGRAQRKKRDFVRGKVYKWDLTGVLPGARGDVEFRQAPGSVEAGEAAGWITLAVAFVAGAVRDGVVGVGEGTDEEEGATVEELLGVLRVGAGLVGWEGLGDVEELFFVGS